MKRKTKIKKLKRNIVQNVGGHMPFPKGINCPKENTKRMYYGHYWLDLSVCHYCNKIKDCQERKNHLLKIKEGK